MRTNSPPFVHAVCETPLTQTPAASLDEQAFARCYRYGQTRTVSVYRFVCLNTIEEKIHKRQINKQTLAVRVVENEADLARQFTCDELEDLSAHDSWVQCDDCKKWRLIPPWVEEGIGVEEGGDYGERWVCSMNIDVGRSRCDAEEVDGDGMRKIFKDLLRKKSGLPPLEEARAEGGSAGSGDHVVEMDISADGVGADGPR